MKARWRILNRTLDVELDFAPTLVYACFVLHNYCEMTNVEIGRDDVQSFMTIERQTQCYEHHEKVDKLYFYSSAQGRKARDALKEYVYD